MEIRGIVIKVSDGTFTSRSNAVYARWKIELGEETCGPMLCTLEKDGFEDPAKVGIVRGAQIEAAVSELRKIPFGAYQVEAKIDGVKVLNTPVVLAAPPERPGSVPASGKVVK